MGSEMSGTQAGYNFAQERLLNRQDLQSYDMRSNSFYNGMLQYVEEQEQIAKIKAQNPSNPTPQHF